MDRKTKIKMLQAVESGKLMPEESLIQIHIFEGLAGAWHFEGKTYSIEEMKTFKEKVEDLNRRRGECGLPFDAIVIITEQE